MILEELERREIGEGRQRKTIVRCAVFFFLFCDQKELEEVIEGEKAMGASINEGFFDPCFWFAMRSFFFFVGLSVCLLDVPCCVALCLGMETWTV